MFNRFQTYLISVGEYFCSRQIYMERLCNCKAVEKAVMEKLLSIKQVTDANLLSGMYDVIVKLESVTSETLRELIIWKIRKIDKIRSIVILMGREPINFLAN